MFLIGVSLDDQGCHAAMVIVKRVRKDLRQYYHVLEVRHLPIQSGDAVAVTAIESAYGNRGLTVVKPRFNQNGRPGKMVRVKPLVLIKYTRDTAGIIKRLRNHCIPVEAFRFQDVASWQKRNFGRGLGHNFTVSTQELVTTLNTVCDQNRLILSVADPADKSRRLIKTFGCPASDSFGHRSENLAAALSLPVWYYENLLALRPKSP